MNTALYLLWEWFTSPIVSGTLIIAGAGIILTILFFTLATIFEKHDYIYPFGIFLALGLITIFGTTIALYSFANFGGAH